MFQFRREAETTAEDHQQLLLQLGMEQRVFEFTQQDGVRISEEEMEVPEQHDRLLRQVFDGLQRFQWVIGVVHGLGLHVDQPIHHGPEVQAVV